jgi:hypothetical protein
MARLLFVARTASEFSCVDHMPLSLLTDFFYTDVLHHECNNKLETTAVTVRENMLATQVFITKAVATMILNLLSITFRL